MPSLRCKFDIPFSSIGLDFTGHYHIKFGDEVQKRYVCIATCLVTRAINVLISKDQSVASLIHVLRRHCYRYGTPITIISDNGSNFNSVNNLLCKHGQNTEIKELLLNMVRVGNLFQLIVHGQEEFMSPW